ncbi:MAG: sulfatase-like hydrolase/transferase [Cytophagaceae bacterium]|jgi:phosphoglycerol transferase MdoB-like AlkP superfamily enzyme|nr:sulfatase-like hydrolase/transferase [Cytophagaceae bacterium]
MKRTAILSAGILRFISIVCVAVAIALIYRFALLISYSGFDNIKNNLADTASAFLLGTRFDLKVFTTLLSPTIVFIALQTIFKLKIFNKITQIYAFITLLVFVLALIGDYFYYGFFATHYNFLIFGFIDDNTTAVLQSIWTDYPVIRVFLFIVLFSVLLYKLTNIIYRQQFARLLPNNGSRVGWGSVVPILFVPLLFLAVRGRVTHFPLQLREAYFSVNPFVNDLAANCFFTLREAVKSYHNNLLDIDIDRLLQESGLEDMHLDSLSLAGLVQHSPCNIFLKENPPHVIVIQMEGMGLNMMNLDSEKLNILGSLAKELDKCIVFRNFLPSFEGTVYSMENLLTGTTITPLSETTFINRLNTLSMVMPFKKAGYKSSFITGCIKGWRNMDKWIPELGFDNLDGMETILHDIPNAVKQKAWGIFDEYLFEQIEHRLANATSPQFIYGFTITNHTPYETPAHYARPKFEIDESMRKLFLKNDEQMLDCFHTYRYACNCLGDFIHKLRNGKHGDNTIVAITGDHSIKGMIKSGDNELLDKYGVPFILYVPQKYLESKIIDTQIYGSHKDIFTTLFNLALSEAKYYPFGMDMLSADAANNIAINFEIGVQGNEGIIVNNRYQPVHVSETQTFDTKNSEETLRTKARRIEIISKYIIFKSLTGKEEKR